MNVEGIVTAVVAGAIGISFLSVILNPGGTTSKVISATAAGFANILTAAKAYPGSAGSVSTTYSG
jgi:hypothetical protein